MPREIVLGNGSMLVNFDRELNMRDFYYPQVGLTNHIRGHRNKLGVWVNGRFSWVDDNRWQRKLGYKKSTMIGQSEAVNHDIGVALRIHDAVHFRTSMFLKKVDITNLDSQKREFRIFFSHDFSINESIVGDTAVFDSTSQCVCHYKRDRYFLINGRIGEEGLFQHSVGLKRFGGAEGTWKDAEDGILEKNPIAHGPVDSVVSFRAVLDGQATVSLYYWIIAGKSLAEVRQGNDFVLERGTERLFEEIEAYWSAWLHKKERDFYDLPEEVSEMFHRSLLVIRTQIDNNGAILAATDSDVILSYPDHYNYMWPRDGALVAYSLDLAGYPEISAKFFEFCARIISEGGYFYQRYNTDGTLGSSWHPWIQNEKALLPIQEDETALVLFALGVHYDLYRDIEFIESLYQPLIIRAADFLIAYRDPVTKLPLPSYDLWEERRGIFTFTCSAVYGALTAATSFASLLKDEPACRKYGTAAQEVRDAMERFLYCPQLDRFLRGVYPLKDGGYEKDFTLDSSLYGLFEFGAFPAGDPRVTATMNDVRENLWVKSEVGGLARYSDDYYCKKSDDIECIPGNPWIICTLWLAEWYIEAAANLTELAQGRHLIEWAVKYALPGGALPEQVHPYTGEGLSVAPLTWSHSTFVLAVEKYLEKYSSLKGAVH